MVTPILPLLPVGGTFHGYAIHERLVDAFRAPLQVFAATRQDGRDARIYCLEVASAPPASQAVVAACLDQLRCIQHERIPAILDGGIDERLLWVAVEVIEGSSLFDQVTSDGPLDPMHVVMLLRDAVAPLRVARDAGVLHGRLTPRHLLTTTAECRAVLGVGFDQLFGPEDDGVNVVYRAPEQLDPGRHVDERADIYALGALAYFALGAPPFEDAGGAFDPERVRQQILTEALPPLARVRPGCPPELEHLLQSLCAKLEEDRPRSLETLSEMLDHTLAACVAHRKRMEPTSLPLLQDPADALHVLLTNALTERTAAGHGDGDVRGTRSAIGAARKPPPPPRVKAPPRLVHRGGSGSTGLRRSAHAGLVLGCVALLLSVAALVLAWRQPPAVAIAAYSAPMPELKPLVELTAPPPPEPPAPRAVEPPRAAPPLRRQPPVSATARPAGPSAAPRPAIERRGRGMLYRKEAP